jgi:hypothetical protein
MDITGLIFNKVTSTRSQDGLTYTAVDYIATVHVLAYTLQQNANGWTVSSVEADDRPANADKTYNPSDSIVQASAQLGSGTVSGSL